MILLPRSMAKPPAIARLPARRMPALALSLFPPRLSTGEMQTSYLTHPCVKEGQSRITLTAPNKAFPPKSMPQEPALRSSSVQNLSGDIVATDPPHATSEESKHCKTFWNSRF